MTDAGNAALPMPHLLWTTTLADSLTTNQKMLVPDVFLCTFIPTPLYLVFSLKTKMIIKQTLSFFFNTY